MNPPEPVAACSSHAGRFVASILEPYHTNRSSPMHATAWVRSLSVAP